MSQPSQRGEAAARMTAQMETLPERGAEPASAYLETDDLRLHYVEWGDRAARPLLLLHGLQDCARSWDQFAREMASDHRVIAWTTAATATADGPPLDAIGCATTFRTSRRW